MEKQFIDDTGVQAHTKYVYESPDKGTTVFRREAGSSHAELVCRACKVGTYVEIVPHTHTCTTCGHEMDSVEYQLIAGYR